MATEVPGYRLAEPLTYGRRGPLRAGARVDDHQRVVIHLASAQLDRVSRGRLQTRARQLRELPPAAAIVPLLAAGTTTDGNAYLVTPRMERSLADLLAVEGPLPLDLILSAGSAALSALSVLHAGGVVHSNITPANLLIRTDGAIALTGARIDVLDEVTGVGPVAHCPPEAVRTGRWTAVGDVYMAGSTLWTLLTGRPPYPDLPSLLGQRLPALDRGDTPDELARLLRRMLATKPVDRPPDTAGLTRTLAAITSGAVAGAHPAGGIGSPARASVPDAAADAAVLDRDQATISPRRPLARSAADRGEKVRRVGRYRIREALGAGGSATVWRAEDELGRMVAIKELRPEYRSSPEALHRFHQELDLLPSLNHAHLVQALEVIVQPDMIALVMPLYGTDLRGVLREAPMERGRYLRVLRQVGAALDFLHNHGVVHRDVKPENVLVERRDPVLVRLTDLGIARIPDLPGITVSDRQPGTVAYMAPELFNGGSHVTAAVDVYAFGVMMYELLSGHRPFEGAAEVVAYGHLALAPPRPADLSAPAWDLLTRCLAKEAADRPKADELPTLLRTLPEAARDGGPGGSAGQVTVPQPRHQQPRRAGPVAALPAAPANPRDQRPKAATGEPAAADPPAGDLPGVAASAAGDAAEAAGDGAGTPGDAAGERAARPAADSQPAPRIGTLLRLAAAVGFTGLLIGLLWGVASAWSRSTGDGGSALPTTTPGGTGGLVPVIFRATAVSPASGVIEVTWSADPAAALASGTTITLSSAGGARDGTVVSTTRQQHTFGSLNPAVPYCVTVAAFVPASAVTGGDLTADKTCLRADGSGRIATAAPSSSPAPTS